LMLLGLYSSHMLSGMSSATSIFQFSCLFFFISCSVNLCMEKGIRYSVQSIYLWLWMVLFCVGTFCMFKWMEYRAK
jgi:hypothetical protein